MPRILGKRIFYGWWISWAASVLYLFNATAFTYGFSLFVEPLSQEYSWSRTQISAVWTATLAVALVSQPLAGWAVDRYGPRVVALLAGPLVGVGWATTALLNVFPSYWYFFWVFTLVVGAGLQTGLVMPGQTAVVAGSGGSGPVPWATSPRGRE